MCHLYGYSLPLYSQNVTVNVNELLPHYVLLNCYSLSKSLTIYSQTFTQWVTLSLSTLSLSINELLSHYVLSNCHSLRYFLIMYSQTFNQ